MACLLLNSSEHGCALIGARAVFWVHLDHTTGLGGFSEGFMHRKLRLGILATVSALAFGMAAQAGVISGAISNDKLATLHNNTRPEANALNDRGRVDDKMRFGGLELILRRSPEQEAAFT